LLLTTGTPLFLWLDDDFQSEVLAKFLDSLDGRPAFAAHEPTQVALIDSGILRDAVPGNPAGFDRLPYLVE
jgi:hypothetical protein